MNKIRTRKSHPDILTVALLLPMLGHVLRKLLPGNPVWAEGLSPILLIPIGIWALRKVDYVPKWLSTPILLLILLQMIWVVIGLFEAPLVAISAVLFRIVPLLMIPIALVAIRCDRDILKIAKVLGALSIAFAVISLYVSINGDSLLPRFLRVVESIEEAKITLLRGQFYTAAAVFSTPTQLGYFGLVAFCVFMALYSANRVHLNITSSLMMTSSFIVLFLSGRRIFAYFSVLLFLYGSYMRKNIIVSIVIGLIILTLIAFIDEKTYMINPDRYSRSEFIFEPDRAEHENIIQSALARFDGMVMHSGRVNLLHYPYGTYLGKYGVEGRAFLGEEGQTRDFAIYYYDKIAIETGLNLLIVEMGFIGAIMWPFLIIYIINKIYILSRLSNNRYIIRAFLLAFSLLTFNFLFKGFTFLMGYQVQAFFFWALPGICAALINEEEPKLHRVTKSY